MYKVNAPVSTDHFIDLFHESTLGDRRPLGDRACMEGMMKNSNLMVTAWDEEKLVGIARSMTDFHYACYLSDLAVHRDYQKKGIGKRLPDPHSAGIGSQMQTDPGCSSLRQFLLGTSRIQEQSKVLGA
jgi:GNAT superfamily N-acetyltransferase